MPTITINFAADELETVQDVLSMLNTRNVLKDRYGVEGTSMDDVKTEPLRQTRAEEVTEKETEVTEAKLYPREEVFKNLDKLTGVPSEPTEEKPKKTRTRKNPTQQEVKEAVKAAKAAYGEQFCFDAAGVVGASVEDTLLKTIREMDKTLYKEYIAQLNKGPSELPEICDSHEEAPVNTTGSLFEESDNTVDAPIEDNTEELADDDDDWAIDDEPEAEAEKVKIDPAGVQQALRAYAQQDRAAARDVLKASGAKTIGEVLELAQDKLLEIMKTVS